MGASYTNNLTDQYKGNVYHINLEVAGWDTTTFQVLAPVATMYIYGSLNDGMPQGSVLPSGNYGAELAIDWSAVQAVNLATGSAVSSISAAGLYSVPVNTRFLRLGGGGADVYALYQHNIKIG